jgi:hypothetical protein
LCPYDVPGGGEDFSANDGGYAQQDLHQTHNPRLCLSFTADCWTRGAIGLATGVPGLHAAAIITPCWKLMVTTPKEVAIRVAIHFTRSASIDAKISKYEYEAPSTRTGTVRTQLARPRQSCDDDDLVDFGKQSVAVHECELTVPCCGIMMIIRVWSAGLVLPTAHSAGEYEVQYGSCAHPTTNTTNT